MRHARRVPWGLAIGAAALLTVLFGFQEWMAPPARREVDLPTSLALRAIAWGLWVPLLPLIVWAARRHPMEGRPTIRWIGRSLIEGAGFVLLHGVLSGTLRWSFGLAVAPALGGAILSGFSAGFASNFLRYSAILVVYQAVVYHDAVREREQRAAQLELELARARLANVEACLRPHFLFNMLNAIAALVREDPAAAERTIGDFSDLLRLALTADPSREVRLDDELVFTQRYLDLERVRFQDRLRVTVDASAEARRALVPQLLLQPIVENAVRHGIAPKEDGGSIVVTAARRNGMLHVSVADNGAGITHAGGTQGAGIGLRGLRTRLSHLYGDRHVLDLRAASPHGTVVHVEIPYRSASA